MAERQDAAEFLQSLLTEAIETMGTGYMMRTNDFNIIGGIEGYTNLLFADHSLWRTLRTISFKIKSGEESFAYWLHENLSKR